MNIRLKLSILIAILLLVFGVSVATYFAVRSPIAEIDREETALAALRADLLDESVQANRLLSASFGPQVVLFNHSVTKTNAAFGEVKNLKLLPKMGVSIKNALDAIQKLQPLVGQNSDFYSDILSQVRGDAVVFYGSADKFDIFHFTTDKALAKSYVGDVVVGHVAEMVKALDSLTTRLNEAVARIDDQTSAIVKQIQAIEGRSDTIALAIIVVLVSLTVSFALILANRIVRSIRSIEGNIAFVRNGDLTRVFHVSTRDEIGRLTADLNDFLGSLRDAVESAQAVSADNIAMKESLISSTGEASASATEINENVRSIGQQISGLDDRLTAATGSVSDITASIGTLNDQIQEQMTMVEQSTAAMTQMIASVESVARITERRRDSTDLLVRTVTEGGEKITGTFEVINRITKNVDSIKDITAIIEGISAQTNLLAMNAAIEAAHAGDAGRGFSVVADEIRKLAEASAENSMEISRILAEIIEGVQDASISSGEMNAAFSDIEREVKEYSGSLSEIHGQMNELRAGGEQVLGAMSVLAEASSSVKLNSRTITESAETIRSTMSDVQRVSSEVHGGMREISSGTHDIAEAIRNVQLTAGRLGELGDTLNRQLTRFRTR